MSATPSVERENSSVESILSLQALCRFTTDVRYLRKRKRWQKVEQEIERDNQR